jgi:hypothetical protein
MRLEVKPTDRLHMLVWRCTLHSDWCVARGINGVCVDYAKHFVSWRDAMDYAATGADS